ncbi:MAG: methyltransferase domain-containing protein [Desulfosporosinus sp.]
MSDNYQQYSAIKENIQKLLEQQKTEAAEAILCEYERINAEDVDIYSLRASILFSESKVDEAIAALEAGVGKYPFNFDLLYNLGFIKEQLGEIKEAYEYYFQAKSVTNLEHEHLINEALRRLWEEDPTLLVQVKQKLAVFVKPGLDNFLDDIIEGLKPHFVIKKIITTSTEQIDQGMDWADICWFEWCDELVAYGSKHSSSKQKKIVCRLHRYEAFSNYLQNVCWETIDKVIFVSSHIMEIVLEKTNLTSEQCIIVPNGINTKRFPFIERDRGFNIACIGYLNVRKNPMLVVQYFNELVKFDSRYQLHFAGSFQDETLMHYLNGIIEKLGIKNNTHFHGFIPNDMMSKWLNSMHYIVTGSIAEGHPVGVMEAMSCGLKPIIHYFPGVEAFYPNKYIYYNLKDFMLRFTESSYDSTEYHKFIDDNYSYHKQMEKVYGVLGDLSGRYYALHHGDEKQVIPKNGEAQLDGDKKVQEYYDNFLTYLVKDRERENPRHTYIKNRLSQIIKSGDKVLDLGCGIGITTEHIKSLGVSKVVGVDLSPELIKYAKNTVKDVEFIVHDITNVNVSDKFDVISLCDVMEHVPRERYEDLFRVIRKHIKKQGIVFIAIPDFNYQNYVLKYRPELLQIIDNSISYDEISNLCKNVDLKVRFYNSYGVFLSNQYTEFVLCDTEAYEKGWESLRNK